VWLGQAKLRHYSKSVLAEVEIFAQDIQDAVVSGKAIGCEPPPIANIERWWGSQQLDHLCSLKGEIDHRISIHSESKDLLLIAFCRVMITISNAAFNHQSMSFQDTENSSAQQELWSEMSFQETLFIESVKSILGAATLNPAGNGRVLIGDSRNLDAVSGAKFDLLVTSPPYPNRMSYIRELRPYMYWLEFLHEAREAGEMDWQAIGGTWGIATSRLNDWKLRSDTLLPGYLRDMLDRIAGADAKSGEILSRYVAKYFEDMWEHFAAARNIVESGGEVHYIIGNSKFYDCLVPAERIYADMLKELGYKDVKIDLLRKRNSKKELLEFDVSARV
jgi:hypothetical protein